MARKPTGNPVGRPVKEIDQIAFEELCKLHCTVSEICSALHTAWDTINDWCKRTYGEEFSVVYKRLIEAGNPSLRRNQYKAAQKGNPTMLIWLGKQWLGQRDFDKLAESLMSDPLMAALIEKVVDKSRNPVAKDKEPTN